MSPREGFVHDSRFMSPCVWARVTATTKTKDVLLLQRVKQQCSCLRDYEYCLHYVRCLMQLSVASCNLIPKRPMLDSGFLGGFLVIDAAG